MLWAKLGSPPSWHQQEVPWHICQVSILQPQPVQPLMQLPCATAPVSFAFSSAEYRWSHPALPALPPHIQTRAVISPLLPKILHQDQLWCRTDFPQPGYPSPSRCLRQGCSAAAQPAAGEKEAEEDEREDAPRVVQELQRWSSIARWCPAPGLELSRRSCRDRF